MKKAEKINRFSDKKFLIIDEYEDLREAISSLCLSCGAGTIVTRDGRVLLFQAIEEKPDLIIINPGKETRSGLYTCKLLKNHGETKHIPILLTIADHLVQHYAENNLSSIDDFLIKPFGTEELMEKIEQIFK